MAAEDRPRTPGGVPPTNVTGPVRLQGREMAFAEGRYADPPRPAARPARLPAAGVVGTSRPLLPAGRTRGDQNCPGATSTPLLSKART